MWRRGFFSSLKVHHRLFWRSEPHKSFLFHTQTHKINLSVQQLLLFYGVTSSVLLREKCPHGETSYSVLSQKHHKLTYICFLSWRIHQITKDLNFNIFLHTFFILPVSDSLLLSLTFDSNRLLSSLIKQGLSDWRPPFAAKFLIPHVQWGIASNL